MIAPMVFVKCTIGQLMSMNLIDLETCSHFSSQVVLTTDPRNCLAALGTGAAGMILAVMISPLLIFVAALSIHGDSHLCVCLKEACIRGRLWPIEQLPWEVLSASSPLVYMPENHVA